MKATYAHKRQALRKYVASGKLAPLLGKSEQELLDYLNQQFPATVGDIPMKIHAVWKSGWQSGMASAADIVAERAVLLQRNNCKDTIREHYTEYAIRYAANPSHDLLEDKT